MANMTQRIHQRPWPLVSLRRAVQIVVIAVLLVGAAAIAAVAGEWPGYAHITCSSVSGPGVLANGHSYEPAISADGRFVAFSSEASNLVPGDTNSAYDIFVRDSASVETTCVSVSTSGTPGGGHSLQPAISSDGRRIAFTSSANNLVAGDANGVYDVFVRDSASAETTCVSVSTAGTQGDGHSQEPAISADGRYIAFTSNAANLVPGDTNGVADVFVRDLASGETTRVSVSSAGAQGDDASRWAAISADGRYAAFTSYAANLVPGDTNGRCDVFVRDLVSAETTRVSVSSAGVQGDLASWYSSISADGRLVAFTSYATNLVAGDTNAVDDVFVRDLASGETKRVSVSDAGIQGDDASFGVSMSADGQFVAIASSATNLVPGDTNRSRDILLCSLADGHIKRVSLSRYGTQGDGASEDAALSDGGRFVAFTSLATNLVPGDTNGFRDSFALDLHASDITLSSVSRTLARFGDAYTLSGTLVSTGMTPLANRRIQLQIAPTASGPWTSTSVEVTTSGDGTFALAHSPQGKTFYRARHVGETELGECVSGVVYALPQASVGAPVAPSVMYAGKAATVYGYLRPRHTSATYPVHVYRYRYVGGVWKSYGYVRAKASNYLGYTRYTAVVTLPCTGRWRLRAYHPADSSHAAGWSPSYDYVSVK